MISKVGEGEALAELPRTMKRLIQLVWYVYIWVGNWWETRMVESKMREMDLDRISGILTEEF